MKSIKSIWVLAIVVFTTTNVIAQLNGRLNNKELAQQQTDEIKKNVDKETAMRGKLIF